MKRTALITGASSGLGEKFAEIFAKDGYNLVLVARNTYKLNQQKRFLEKKYGVKVKIFIQDLSQQNSAKKVFDFTQQNGIHIDILVNNAGFGDLSRFDSCDIQKQVDMINLNITTLVQLTYFYLKPMQDNGYGKIMNIASIAGFASGPLMSVYYASKAFVLHFSEAIATELKDTPVTVTTVCPGPVKTEFFNRAGFKNQKYFNIFSKDCGKKVCEYAYTEMLKGKTVVVPGIINKIGVTACKFAPREITKNVVYMVQKSRL